MPKAKPFAGKTALVTGASRGLGRELAREAAEAGANVVLAARNRAELEQAAREIGAEHSVSATALPVDLGEPNSVAAIYEALTAQGIAIDVLINNAGIGVYGTFHETDPARGMAMLRLNVLAATELSRIIVPGMVARGWGRVLFVGSTSSFQPVPNMAAYGASKAYVLSFSHALRDELRGTGVSVTCLSPGATATHFFSDAKMLPVRLSPVMPADRVARIGMRALVAGKPHVVAGLVNKLGAAAARFVPRPFATRVAALVSANRESP